MNVTIKTKVGHQVVECSAATLVDAISLSSPLGELPPDCGLCGSVDLAPRQNDGEPEGGRE